jgi:hypothetical protein
MLRPLVVPLLFLASCSRGTSTEVKSPGVHIESGYGSRSVVWSGQAGQRVCTLATGGARGHKMRLGRGAGSGKQASEVDALLFRLCEARGNGDISAEQYALALDRLLFVMAHRGGALGRFHKNAPSARGPHTNWRQGRPGLGPWPHGRCKDPGSCPYSWPKEQQQAAPPAAAPPPAETEVK